MIGVVFVNFLSDLQGRKFSLIISMSVQVASIVSLIIGASYDQVSLMAIA
jgi:MFS family permease